MIKKKIGAILSSFLLSSALIGCQAASPKQEYDDNDQQEQKAIPEQKTVPEQKESENTVQEKQPNSEMKEETPSSKPAFQATGDLKIYFLDVGQGDSIYIKTPKGDDILIDGGNNDKGDEVVSYLNRYHVDDIEVMIATHPDADHIGGLDQVLQDMKVESVYLPKITHTTKTFEDFVLAVKDEGLKLKEAKAGKSLDIEGVDAKFLAPVKSYGNDLNTSSAVLKITYGENSFLFTGDATIESEQDMIASHENLQADVLKLGHHGANTSTSEAFLEKVHPAYGVISVGEGNRYGHPTDETLQKLKAHGVQIERTDEQGTILAISDGSKLTFKNEPSLLSKTASPPKAGTVPAPPVQKPAEKPAEPSDSQVNDTQALNSQLTASVDNPTPGQYETIRLQVTGATGAPYTAVLHYKSKDTVYTGTVGTPLPIKISRASAGFEVTIDITADINGKEVQTQTSFIPQ